MCLTHSLHPMFTRYHHLMSSEGDEWNEATDEDPDAKNLLHSLRKKKTYSEQCFLNSTLSLYWTCLAPSSTARYTLFVHHTISRDAPPPGTWFRTQHQFIMRWERKGKNKKKAQHPAGFVPTISWVSALGACALPLCYNCYPPGAYLTPKKLFPVANLKAKISPQIESLTKLS